MPISPIAGSINANGATSTPAVAEMAAEMPHTREVMRFTGTPL